MSKAEKFISDCTRNCSNIIVHRTQYGGVDEHQPWLAPDQARRAVEIARKEIYEWLQKNAYKYSNIGFYTDAMMTDLKKAMKDE